MFSFLLATALAVAGPPQAPVLLDTPFVAQTEALCGGAALTMVMRYWGDHAVNAEDFASLVVPAEHGIPTSALLGAATARGWSAALISPDQLADAIRHTRPVIALIAVGPDAYHYVVIVGVTPDMVVLHDPARSPYRTMRRKDFDAASAKANRWMAVVMPSEAMAPPTDPVTCDALVASAVDAAKTGDTSRAANMLDAAIFRCPSNPGPWRERAGLAFADKQYAEAARLAERSLALDPQDEYTRELLATSRFLSDQPLSALKTWDRLRVTRVEVTGATRTPQSLILSRLHLNAGDRLTSGALALAEHRISEIPSLADARVRFTPDQQHQADVAVIVGDRPRVPAGLIPWTVIGARAAIVRSVSLSFASWLGAGDRLDVMWRFQKHRELIGGTLTVPSPRGVPGNLEFFGRRERQTFPALGVSGATDQERRRRGGVAISDWATDWLKWRAGVALDRIDTTRSLAFSVGTDVRLAGDRLSIGGNREMWFRDTARGAFERNQLRAAARTSTSDLVPRLLVFGAWTDVSRAAPRSVWPAADVNFLHEGALRAHPLFDAGVLTSDAFGRRLATATLTYEHPIRATALATFSGAAFIDAARAWRTGVDRAARPIVDVGVGVRATRRTFGTLRLDLAVGTRDGRVRVSAGYMPAWPR
jgi:hypothetical protein